MKIRLELHPHFARDPNRDISANPVSSARGDRSLRGRGHVVGAVCVALLISTHLVGAAELLCSPTGAGSDYTLAEALALANGGDTVTLKNGTYSSTLFTIRNGTSASVPIVIRAQNPHLAIVAPPLDWVPGDENGLCITTHGGETYVRLLHKYIVLRDLIFDGQNRSYSILRIGYPANDDVWGVTLENNIFRNPQRNTLFFQSGRDIVIRHNTIEGAPTEGFYIGSSSSSPILDNVQIYGNFISSTGSNPIDIKDGTNFDVHHNVIENHYDGNICSFDGTLNADGSNLNIHDNIIRTVATVTAPFDYVKRGAGNNIHNNVLYDINSGWNAILWYGSDLGGANTQFVNNMCRNTGTDIEGRNGVGGYPASGLVASGNIFGATQAQIDAEVARIMGEIPSLPGYPGGTAELRGHWMFNETSGTSAADSSGNANTGALTGFSGTYWVPGQVGGGLNFDGVDDIVNAGSGATLDNLPAITVAAWIKAANLGEGNAGRIMEKSSGLILLLNTNNRLDFTVDYATTDLKRQTADNAIVFNTWQHVAATWNGSATATNVHIYINGVEVGSYATTTNGAGARVSDAAGSLYIGNRSAGDRTFNGLLDDVRIYNGVLSANEILALAQATPPTITTTTLPSGRTTISYGNQQLNASGGTIPYAWSLAAGTLPAGLGLSSAGVISGTPTTAGTSNFTVRVTDAASQFDDQALSINIATNSIPSITTTTLPGGSVGVAYNQTVASTGGDVALAWSVLSGSLPAGLVLSNVNNQNATISGTPTTAGTSNFTLQIADVDNDTDTQALSIVISGAPAAPSGLTAADVAYNQINLAWTDNSSTETGFKIERKKGAGGIYSEIGTAAANAISYNDTTAGTGTTYYYRVRATNASGDSGYSNEASDSTPEVTGRQGHWKLDENAGTTPQDSSGNANHGTMNPAPGWIAGKIGSALNFDGVDDMVNCQSGATLDQLAALTVTAWIKADTMGEGGAGRIVQKGAGLYGGWRIYILGTNKFGFAVDYATTDLSRDSVTGAVPFGAWKHVVATWTGSATATNAKLYIDGVEASYSTTTNGSGARASDSAGNLQIGNDSTLARSFDGVIDDVRVYNRVLSTAEIQAVYRAGM